MQKSGFKFHNSNSIANCNSLEYAFNLNDAKKKLNGFYTPKNLEDGLELTPEEQSRSQIFYIFRDKVSYKKQKSKEVAYGSNKSLTILTKELIKFFFDHQNIEFIQVGGTTNSAII